MADLTRKQLIDAHQEWLGYAQPVGLVVAPTVLVDRQVIPDRNIAPRHQRFLELLSADADGRRLSDIPSLFTDFLGWRADDLAAPPADLETALPELGATLSPTWAVPATDPAEGEAPWQMLIRVEADGLDLDAPSTEADGWSASAHDRFQRLLRETSIPIGLIATPRALRLIYAPKGETSGHITFNIAEMTSVAGRPLLAAFDLLLGESRLFTAPAASRLPALLAESRRAQAEVSTKLAGQVLDALYELLRGFIAADARANTDTVTGLARRQPDHLYGGLITCLMRLVFILYAEDRGLMPADAVYVQHYAVAGLFARLRADAALNPDTMDARFGAWAQLLVLFRLIHAGGGHGGLRFVARKGRLFDPDTYTFLEGRRGADDGPAIPPVPDGTVWRILEKLMVLDGERLSYLTLDVEQIGSVYETIMGFTVELTAGRAIAVKSPKRHGAATIVDCDALLALKPAERGKRLLELTGQKLTGQAEAALKAATAPEDVSAALDRKVDRGATPYLVPAGTAVLQPTEERRRSGSHYTPRSLTAPIVSEALRPILEPLGPDPTPEQILDLKVLDPAVGSGAFLVETCRQLAKALSKAWTAHKATPPLPPDEDGLTHARRLIAARCLYGVDKNPLAAELTKLSLWLATLAKDHEFTFVDHAIRAGDSLVGLSRRQIETLSWDAGERQHSFAGMLVRDRIKKAEDERRRIREATEGWGEECFRPLLDRADRHLDDVRLIGNAVIAAFFAGDKPKARQQARAPILEAIDVGGAGWQERLTGLAVTLKQSDKPIRPFHYEIEFPEVFDRLNPGFDAIVGNPPFSGKNGIIATNREGFLDWLKALHEGAHGNADLVAHFFRRAFGLLRQGGAFGLIATNTIRQGDTRATGLRHIRQHGGTIYRAARRIKWPGEAAVVVSVVHIAKDSLPGPYRLDGREVPIITAYLFHAGGDDDPEPLEANASKSFIGSYVLGMGFTFDDTDTKGVASPLAEMHRLIAKDPRNAERIFPYIGGEEVNDSPTHAHDRYVINFADFPLKRDELGRSWERADEKQRQAWLRTGVVPLDYPDPVAADWPDLVAIVEEKVKPERLKQNREIRARYWWKFGETTPALFEAIRPLDRVLAISRVTQHYNFVFLNSQMVFSENLVIFLKSSFATFCSIQSRVHESWCRFFASTLEDRPRYNPSEAYETFPFPEGFETDAGLEAAGEAYYRFRAELMVTNNEGLTKTYNRFHDPDERSNAVHELRRLHDTMDRAVLAAYGWDDLAPDCVFELEWEEDDEEGTSRRKKPWRYRWPEATRDEVLARLLALNATRAAEERLSDRKNREIWRPQCGE